MKYAIAAIALVGAVAAMPTEPEPVWETWTTTTTSKAEETWGKWTTTTTTTKDEKTWEPYPVPTKCSEVKTEYYTKYDDENNKWGNYHVETKYVTEYPEKCSETSTWAAWSTTSEEVKPTWAPAPVPDHKCSDVKTEYYTKYDDENNKWGNYHVETKYVTEYPETCTETSTWAAWSTTSEEVKPTTWATWVPESSTKETPSASTEWVPVKVSSTVSAPVAKWTGAASKANIAGGLAGVAGLAALLL